MAISQEIRRVMNSPESGAIRKMFEEGIELKKKYGEDAVFDFSIGNPDLDPPEEVLKVLEEESRSREKNFHGYMPNAGYPFARAAMAEKTAGEQGVACGASCVVMSVGAAGALNALFRAIVSQGDEVVVPAPYFSEYAHYVKNCGGTLVAVGTKEDFSLDVAAVERALCEKTAAVLINSPNNPTGRVYSEEEIRSLSDALRRHAKRCGRAPYLVCDEPYRAIVYDGARVAPVFPHYDEAVIVTSFAKNLSLPGERIGYICVNPAAEDKDELVAACIFTTRTLGFVNAPALFQRVVAKAWHAKADYGFYEKRRGEICAILDEAGIVYTKPEGAFYVWCKAPDQFAGDDGAFCNYLKRYNILTAPGAGFGGAGYIRLAYCASEKTILSSRAAFLKAMKDLEVKK